MFRHFLFLASVLLFSGCQTAKVSDKSYTSPNITVQKVRENVYRHTTFLQTESFGKVSCNGMVVFDRNEAVIFDTPVNDSMSAELIKWVDDSLKCKVIAIIPTHFHADCLGGLNAFHERGIPSYASNLTIKAAKLKNYAVPQNGFDNILKIKAGHKKVIAAFYGEGHTRDNIIGYFPDEKVMFGGCLIKEMNATKGNLEDANVNDWSETVTKIKAEYPDAEVVIPGHGESGSTALLDYTIKLFQQN
ncbi:subclass B1 metallo-beta-lactamase [Dyadobacter flavalbus]|uniref:Beta-lactamase n=1 Tax=Dyadobacter flavalbus TaxID=2579942 RepID=A0A5M8Q9J0_9BACT|nr:subclass B1 metallo-beta-lactamase [Dyadobacter flavalbus]KAA6432637.1 subclass B1 metallo-beta-lactamase [Dyadobacter flavalbus]